jgi:non-canonical purine NTP pyrophosphatase (RdgB/HAM1 family)
MQKPILITGSKYKLAEINGILSFSLENTKLDLEEIQSLDIYKIAKDKALRAHRILNCPVVIEDIGFYIDSMNDFPGPLIKWFLGSIGDKGIYYVTKNFKDKSALTRCVVCYFDGKRFRFFTGDVKGKIVDPKNRKAFGFDSIFKPRDLKKTYASLTLKEKNKISHRAIAWKKFEEFYLGEEKLIKHKNS